MGHRVRVTNSGHQFTTEERISLLRAGLNAGLNFDHSCETGNCGRCKARLASGDIEQVCFPDYRLTPEEQASGVFLLCCNRAVSDLEIETHETDTTGEIEEQHVTAKVSKVERLQEQVIQLSVRTPRSGGLHFLAGQQAVLHFDGMRPKALSIASCPCDAIQLRFHVRLRKNDPFSEFVFERLKRGREVVLTGPQGDLTIDEESNRPMIFIAWESGFAPIASLIDHVIQKETEREIHLYWLSAIARGHYLSNYCRAWRDALDDFHYHSIDLAPFGPDTPESVIADLCDRHAPLSGWDACLCLPEDMLHRALDALKACGMPGEQVRSMLQPHA